MTEQPWQAPAAPDASAEEAQAAAAAALQNVGADLGAGTTPAATPEQLGVSLAASGAAPDEVDPQALLAAIRSLQSQVDQMQAEKRMEQAPALVTYAQALADHVAAKIAAHPHTAADVDLPGQAGIDLSGAVLEAARAAAESGDISAVAGKVNDVVGWVRMHAAKFNHIDWSYVLQLAEEVTSAAAKLAV
jgi:hypothetical protein